MTRSSRHRDEINILRISLDGPSSIRFELFIRGQISFQSSAPGEPLGLFWSSEEVREQFRNQEPSFTLPETLIEGLTEALVEEDGPIWVELDPPGSRLALVPWEQLLRKLPVALLRLPSFFLSQPPPVWSSLDVVLCTSFPSAKETIPVEDLVLSLITDLLWYTYKPTTVHLFANESDYKSLRERLIHTRYFLESPDEGKHGVYLYSPKASNVSESATRSRNIVNEADVEADVVDNPWLKWMIDSLPDRTIDLVHFVCHGFFSMDQGALAFAESPLQDQDQELARLVGVQQLNDFLNRVGAWSVAFTSPPNASIAGLRILCEQIARLRLGGILLQDARNSYYYGWFRGGTPNIRWFYDFMFGSIPLSASTQKYLKWIDASFYYPPVMAREQGTADMGSNLSEQLETLQVLAQTIEDAEKTGNTWMSSCYRLLEQEASELVAFDPLSEAQAATREGSMRALNFVSALIRRHAGRGQDSSTEEA